MQTYLEKLDLLYDHYHWHIRKEVTIAYEQIVLNLKGFCNVQEIYHSTIWPKFFESIKRDEEMKIVE